MTLPSGLSSLHHEFIQTIRSTASTSWSILAKTLEGLVKTDGTLRDYTPCPVRVNADHRGRTKTARGKQVSITLDCNLVYLGSTRPLTNACS